MSLISLLFDDLKNPSFRYNAHPFRFELESSDLNNCETIPDRIKKTLNLPSQNFTQWPLSLLTVKSKEDLSCLKYGANEFELRFSIPAEYNGNEIAVNIRNNMLVIKGEHTHIDEYNRSRTSFFIKKYHIPDCYDFENIKSIISDNILSITIPILSTVDSERSELSMK